MRKTRFVSFRRLTALLMPGILILGAAPFLRGQDQPPGIVGAWILAGTTGSGRPDNFPLVFHADGTGVAMEKGPVSPDGTTLSSGVAVWKQTGDRQFTFTVAGVIYSNSQGDLGFWKAKGVATLDDTGNSFTSTFIFTGSTLDGTVFTSSTSTVTAKRVVVETP